MMSSSLRENLALSASSTSTVLNGLAWRRVVAEDHLDSLAAQVLAQYRKMFARQRGLVDVKLIGVDCTLHDGFTESVGKT